MITPNTHEKAEWSRFAQSLYSKGLNKHGHMFSAAASLPTEGKMDNWRFDYLQDLYRAWLCFDTYPTPSNVY